MSFAQWVQLIDDHIWGPWTLALFTGTGILLTLRTRFLPWRNLGWALGTAMGREARTSSRRGGVSPFSALMTALAATIGTGNIVGVATALAAGGPGALVWMELSALLGLSTKFAECMLSVKYRRRDPAGQWIGGPMYVMSACLGRPGRHLGRLFAVFAAAASLGIGGMTQSNSIAESLRDTAGLPVHQTGLVTALLALVIILGGIRRVSAVSSLLVPVMAVGYLASGTAVILLRLEALPGALAVMFREAFSFRAAAGGAIGSAWTALRWGVARGVLSNEAGMGSAAIAAASADGQDPVRQGYISMTAVFFDTMVICTVTGLAICCSGVLGTAEGAGLTLLAFRSVLGERGGIFLCGAIVLFAFSTILGWEVQGEQAVRYLSGGRSPLLYRLAFALAVFWGAGAGADTVFRLTDICNALMALPNLLCLLALSGTVAEEAAAFQKKQRKKL